MNSLRRLVVASGIAGIGLGLPGPAFSASGPARLIADLNQVPSYERGSFPEGVTPVGSYSLFRARTRATGYELWRTDGTEAGTRLVKDLWPGPNGGAKYYGYSSSPIPLDPVVFGDAALFIGNDGAHGWELWRTDGTGAGTFMVKDIHPGPENSFEQGFDYHDERTLVWKHFVVGDLLLFLADDGVHGLEWWRTDGTEAGTQLFKEIMPGRGGAFGAIFSQQLYNFSAAFVGDLLYFAAADDITGLELWRTDGTPGGTTRVRDINPGADGSYPSQMIDLNGVLIFTAYEPRGGSEIWRSDGTFAGTAMVRDIFPGSFGSSPNNVRRVGDLIYFGSYQYLYRTDGTFPGTVLLHTFDQGSTYPVGALEYKAVIQAWDREHGGEFWLSDGTPAGTRLLKDINPGSASSYPYDPVEVDGRLYFVANNGASGTLLWTSDGSEEGTHRVADLSRGSSYVSVSGLHRAGSHCLFNYYADERTRLMASDGTAEGTVSLRDLVPDSVGDAVDGTLYLGADDGVHGFELWRTDGTSGGTALVKDLEPNLRTNQSYPIFLGTLDTPGAPIRTVFTADDGVHGRELWVSDGTAAGTHLVKDLVAGRSEPYLGSFITYRGAFYFTAYGGDPLYALWRTDGTEAGTVPVIDPTRAPMPDSGTPLVEYQGLLYYFAHDEEHGVELWRSDGTAEGSEFVADLNPGPADTYADSLLVVGGTLFISAYTDATGSELFKSDGTAAGTTLVKDIIPGPDSGYPTEFARFGDRLIMTAGDDEHGRELWVSDGTEAGTMMLKDIDPGSFGGVQYGSARVESGGAFYFIGYEPVHGAELWRTDGTPEGTVMVKDVVPGRNSGYIEALTEFKGAIWFGVRGFPYDDQLWRSDGTEAGTVPVKVGFILGVPGLKVVDDALIFSGNDFDAHGRELWRSDGTQAGTGMLQDLDPGAEGSDPQSFVVAGDRVFFTADDGSSDTEPWVARAAILARNPRQGVQDLIDEVKRLGLPKGEETSLLAQLNSARSALDDGRQVTAVVALEVFANHVDVLAPLRLSEVAAADLRQFAAEITGLLEGASRPRGPKPKAAAPRTTGRPAGVTVTPVAAHLP